MRTRIALVAIVSIALITVTLLRQLVSVQPARAANAAPRPSVGSNVHSTHDRLTADITSSSHATSTTTAPPQLGIALLAGKPAGTKEVVPVPPPAPTDTVTPAQRAAWERVAMCEEGGNWHADGGRFSGGLGITRANWAAYGGLQYASEGALATPDQQIMVAEHIQSYPPDQGGCRGW